MVMLPLFSPVFLKVLASLLEQCVVSFYKSVMELNCANWVCW